MRHSLSSTLSLSEMVFYAPLLFGEAIVVDGSFSRLVALSSASNG